MEITKREFGRNQAGQTVNVYRILNRQGAYVDILDHGCIVQKIVVPDQEGKMTDVVLGYDDIAGYEENDCYLGAAIGRCGNRIAGGRFKIGDKVYNVAVNNGKNHLHGGVKGFDKQLWQADKMDNGLRLQRLSPDGEENYPGNLNVAITYSFSDDNELKIVYEAVSDADTVVNLTNHSYFNLNGAQTGDILQHELQLFADAYLPTDKDLIPTGKLRSVEGTVFDFRTAKTIGRDIAQPDSQLLLAKGYDHTYVLSGEGLRRVAVARGERSGIVLEAYTTQPGVQLYTGNYLGGTPGKYHTEYMPHHGFCLETQHFPNAVNQCNFATTLLKCGERYNQETVYRFGL